MRRRIYRARSWVVFALQIVIAGFAAGYGLGWLLMKGGLGP